MGLPVDYSNTHLSHLLPHHKRRIVCISYYNFQAERNRYFVNFTIQLPCYVHKAAEVTYTPASSSSALLYSRSISSNLFSSNIH